MSGNKPPVKLSIPRERSMDPTILNTTNETVPSRYNTIFKSLPETSVLYILLNCLYVTRFTSNFLLFRCDLIFHVSK